MGDIFYKDESEVNYQTKLDYCLSALKKHYSIKDKYDEFTKERSLIVIGIDEVIFSEVGFVDTGFTDLSDGQKDLIRYTVYAASEKSIKESEFASDQAFIDRVNEGNEKLIQEEIMNSCERLKTHSSLECRIGYCRGEGYDTFIMHVQFMNYSHHRDLSSLKLYFKQENGDVILVDKVIPGSSPREEGGKIEDNVSLEISREQLDFIIHSTKVSARFDNIEVICLNLTNGEIVQEMRFIIEEDRSEATTHLLYQRLKKEEEQERLEAEKRRIDEEIAQTRKGREKCEKDFLKLNFHDSGLLRRLLDTPTSIPQFKKLSKFCSENELSSNVVSFVESIPEHFDLKTIKWELHLFDEQVNQEEKSIKKSFGIFAVISFIVNSAIVFEYSSYVLDLILSSVLWVAACGIPYIFSISNGGFMSEEKANKIGGIFILIHIVFFFIYVSNCNLSFGVWGSYIYFVIGMIMYSNMSNKHSQLKYGPNIQDLINQLSKTMDK